MFSIINNNYYSHWQFIPAKWVWIWPRSGFRMSPIATTQVPVGISLPRQKNFAWKYNCQIRHIKLHYTIIFSSQTIARNLNSSQITKKFPIRKRITTPKVKIKLQENCQNSQMSHINAKAQKTNQNKRQMSLALQSAQITNANINFNFNLPNLLSSYSAGTSTQDKTGGNNNSAGEQLRTAPQNAEPKSNRNDTAQQPNGIQTRRAHSSMELQPRQLRHIPCHTEQEMHSPEEGEIPQPISPTVSNQLNLTAANTIPFPTITKHQENSFSNGNTNAFSYHANDTHINNYNGNPLPISKCYVNDNSSSTNINCPTYISTSAKTSYISTTSRNAYHANNNAPNEPNSQLDHTSNPNHIPTNISNAITSSQSPTPMVLTYCPTSNQLSSAPAAEHRSAWKQPCIRYVKLPSYNTASTYTNRCPTGNQLSSAPAAEHRSAGKQPCIRYVKLPPNTTASTYTNRCPTGNQLSSAPASSSLFTQVEQLKAVGIPKTIYTSLAISPCFFHLSSDQTIILRHHSNQLFRAVSTQTPIHLQRWKREQTHLPTPAPPPMPPPP